MLFNTFAEIEALFKKLLPAFTATRVMTINRMLACKTSLLNSHDLYINLLECYCLVSVVE